MSAQALLDRWWGTRVPVEPAEIAWQLGIELTAGAGKPRALRRLLEAMELGRRWVRLDGEPLVDFAVDLLIPRQLLDISIRANPGLDIAHLAASFSVPRSVVVYQLRNVGYIPP